MEAGAICVVVIYGNLKENCFRRKCCNLPIVLDSRASLATVSGCEHWFQDLCLPSHVHFRKDSAILVNKHNATEWFIWRRPWIKIINLVIVYWWKWNLVSTYIIYSCGVWWRVGVKKSNLRLLILTRSWLVKLLHFSHSGCTLCSVFSACLSRWGETTCSIFNPVPPAPSPLPAYILTKFRFGDLWIILFKNVLKHQSIEMLFVWFSPKHDIVL